MYMKRPPAGGATAIAGSRVQRSSSCWEAARPAHGLAFCCALCTLQKPDQARGPGLSKQPLQSRSTHAQLQRTPTRRTHSTQVAATAAARLYTPRPTHYVSSRYANSALSLQVRTHKWLYSGCRGFIWVTTTGAPGFKSDSNNATNTTWGLIQALTALSRPPASLTQDAVRARRAPSSAVQST